MIFLCRVSPTRRPQTCLLFEQSHSNHQKSSWEDFLHIHSKLYQYGTYLRRCQTVLLPSPPNRADACWSREPPIIVEAFSSRAQSSSVGLRRRGEAISGYTILGWIAGVLSLYFVFFVSIPSWHRTTRSHNLQKGLHYPVRPPVTKCQVRGPKLNILTYGCRCARHTTNEWLGGTQREVSAIPAPFG
ncbi:hypothetical protein H4582DRAFT_1206827 [Lactarius indigo]|nr:hypothetical protein H4582DRAFT_1206827 [Lactarius indigo]